MKSILTICLLLLVLQLHSQEHHNNTDSAAPAYFLDTLKGWGVEKFSIPASFAPSIPYKGVEDIRFAPGWGKKESEDYWSYVFVWSIQGKANTDIKIISQYLSAYYTGLLHANLDTTKITADKVPAAVISIRSEPAANGSEFSYSGTVHTLDFLTWQPIDFNFNMHIITCKEQNSTLVFHAISPQPYSHSTWQSFEWFRKGLKCGKRVVDSR